MVKGARDMSKDNVIDLPEFMKNKNRRIVSMDEEEFKSVQVTCYDAGFNKGYRRGFDKGFTLGALIMGIILVIVGTVAFYLSNQAVPASLPPLPKNLQYKQFIV